MSDQQVRNVEGITSLFEQRLTRRSMLRTALAIGAGAATAGLLGAGAAAAAPLGAQLAAPRRVTRASLAPAQLELWYQDWPPLTAVFQSTASAVQAAEPNVTIKLTPLPYEQLQEKLLPSIAAGQESDLIYGYSSWLVAADVSKLFVPVVPELMSLSEAQASFYASALTEGTRGDQVYYLPFANGQGGSTFTYNVAILQQAGIDPSTVNSSWDSLVNAGKALTTTDSSGTITRAGIGFSPYMASAWVSGVLQMGAQYYDPSTNKFNLTSAESMKSLKAIDDLLKVDKVDDITKEAQSHTNMTGYSAPDGFEKGLAAITNFGSWIVSGYEKTSPSFQAGIFRMPYMGTAAQVIELSHNAIIAMSRKLANDADKKAAAKFWISKLVSPDTLGPLADIYGGSIIVPPVTRDPSITQRRWGSLQKQYDEQVWPVATFEKHHIADWGISIAWPALLKIFKDSAPMEETLKALEDQSNDLESQAMERLNS